MNADTHVDEFALEAAQEWLDDLDTDDRDEQDLRSDAATFIDKEVARVAEMIRLRLTDETDRIIADILAGEIA